MVLSSREVWSHTSLQTLPLGPGQVDVSPDFIPIALRSEPTQAFQKNLMS